MGFGLWALGFAGLGSSLKCGFGDGLENETDEVDAIVYFCAFPKTKSGNRDIPKSQVWEQGHSQNSPDKSCVVNLDIHLFICFHFEGLQRVNTKIHLKRVWF